MNDYKTCANCHELFRAKRKDAKFCSKKCQDGAKKRRKRDAKNNFVPLSELKAAKGGQTTPKHAGVSAEWRQHGPHPEGQFIHPLCGLKVAYLLKNIAIYCPHCQSYGEFYSRWPRT